MIKESNSPKYDLLRIDRGFGAKTSLSVSPLGVLMVVFDALWVILLINLNPAPTGETSRSLGN